jgi:peptide/nickel transport system ATP-binding protein
VSSAHSSVAAVPAPLSAVPALEPESVVTVRDLHVSLVRNRERSPVLRGVSLDIQPGEVLGVVGESGSGKSVLALSMLGLLPESAQPEFRGELQVAGTDMLHGSEAARRAVRRVHLGAVFQDPMTSLNPTMRVGEQIEEASGSSTETIRLLRAVGVPEPERRVNAYPHELSGGLRQRVMIAMAVAGSPSLVIADEPTTALDVTVQAQVLTLLRSLRDEVGCSVLLITHDLGVAAQISNRIAVMYAGRLAEVGSSAAVLQRPTHPYTVGLLGSRLTLATDRHEVLRTLPPDTLDLTAREQGCLYRSRCPLAMPVCADEVPQMLPPPRVGLPAHEPGHLRACFSRDVERHRVRALTAPALAGADELLDVPPTRTPAPAGDRTGAAVSVNGLTCSFGVKAGRGRKSRLQALRGVSLEVAPGESVAIVGESGSGKSTLLRTIAGLQRADGGQVRVADGARPQMVFQDAGASLTPWLTVGAMLAERLATEGVPRAQRADRVAAALDQVGLPEGVSAARAGELSGGQRQRVALARATIVPPPVLLCDEPTSALDVSLAATVLNLVQQLRRDLGMAVLFVTHDLSVARIIGDRIAVMYLGRLVEVGPAEELVARPRHPYTRALLSAVPDLGVAAPAVVGEPASPLAPPSGCAYHPRCPAAEAACSEELLDVKLERLRPGLRNEPTADRLVACIRQAQL